VNALYVSAVLIALFWITVNLVYRYTPLRGSSSISIYGYVVLVFKKPMGRRVGEPTGRGRRVLNSLVTLLYFAALLLFLYLVVNSVLNRFSTGASGVVLLVPGVNVVGLDALMFILTASIGASLHELLHARLALRNNIPVKSYGVMLALVIPLAYVEVDEEGFKNAGRWSRVSVLSAGVAVNLVLALIGMALLPLVASPLGVMVTSVEPGSPAEKYGLQPYDVILGINGTEVKGLTGIPSVKNMPKPTVLEVTVYRGGMGVINITIPIGASDERIGIYLAPAPRIDMAESIGLLPSLLIYKFITWMYIVNLSLAIINAAPLFITDGGRIIQELTGRYGSIVNTIGLLMLLLMILP